MNFRRLVSGALVLASMTFSLAADPRPVAFNWFEYSGHDPAFDSQIAPDQYRNPILSGFYPDPSLCRVGDDYYLVNSTFAYFPGIPIFQSRDLVNWKQLGNVISRPEQLHYAGLTVSSAIFAPAISYHDGTFYVVCTMVGSDGNFVVTATNPAGPWSKPIALMFEGIDPSLFFDDDNRAWIVNNGAPEGKPLYGGHRAIWIQEFDSKADKMIGFRKIIVNGGVDITKNPIWIEGPHLLKRDSWYYLCCAEGGTGPQHSQVIFRSHQVDGPYTPWDQNPILTQRDLDGGAPSAVTSTGHASLIIGPDKNWWAVFLGVRPYQGRFSPMGRETFLLPVKWTEDGWPVILPKGERVPLTGNAPVTASTVPSDATPLTGSFVWRDDFKAPELSPLWLMLRTPKETWWKVGGGQLSITPQADQLTSTGNPSFLAHRVQHTHFTASTSLEIPSQPQISAGLSVYQNENHHYFLSAHRNSDGVVVSVERLNGGPAEIISTTHLPNTDKIDLQITGNEAKCSFAYATTPGSWTTLVSDADATLLTSDVAGGFVGATVGPCVRLDKTDTSVSKTAIR